MPDEFTCAGYERHLRRQLDILRPGLIIAVDRPSERFSRTWAGAQTDESDVFYYTRRRDAHAERKLLLAELRERYGA